MFLHFFVLDVGSQNRGIYRRHCGLSLLLFEFHILEEIFLQLLGVSFLEDLNVFDLQFNALQFLRGLLVNLFRLCHVLPNCVLFGIITLKPIDQVLYSIFPLQLL